MVRKKQCQTVFVIIVFLFMSIFTLTGCFGSKQTIDKAQDDVKVTTPALPSFDEKKNWVNPDFSPYDSGLTSVTTPEIPTAFEQSTYWQKGVAGITVGKNPILDGKSFATEKSWTQEIQFYDYSFEINGQVYSVPSGYRKQKILLLPVDHGIVWSPVQIQFSKDDPEKALEGSTFIYYTPYRLTGGSLTNDVKPIAEVPHSWLGPDGPVVASAWTGWLPKSEVRMADVQSQMVYDVKYPNIDQLIDYTHIQSIARVQGKVPGWDTLLLTDLSKKAYFDKPPYAVDIQSLTRTFGGFVLTLLFFDETTTGRNAGLAEANYYWSEKTGKWTPLNQGYMVQISGITTDIGSKSVFWQQILPPLDVSYSLNVAQMYFDPETLSMKSIWLGNHFYDQSIVAGKSWVVNLPQDTPKTAGEQPKKWTVYTP